MITVGDAVVSRDIFEKKFVCDLNKCKGACCVEGDGGPIVTEEEIQAIEENLPAIKPYMRTEGLTNISEGIHHTDFEGDTAINLVNNKECVFVSFDEKGMALCSIEQAYRDGKSTFKKPISCHLYPVKTKTYRNFTAVNYHSWNICSDACALGEELSVRVFEFCKEPLIRKFGESWYSELQEVHEEMQSENS